MRSRLILRPVDGSVALKALLVLGVAGLCALALGDRLSDIRLSSMLSAVAALSPWTIALALGLGALSHMAVSCYELLALDRIGRRVPWPRALSAGFAGTVMAETFGFGMVTGTLARARLYRANGITPAEALALSGFVSAGFFAGLGVLLAALLLIDPGPASALTGAAPQTVRGLAVAALGVLALAAALGTAHPKTLRVGKATVTAPNGGWLARSAVLAAADLIPAALCLAVLLPADALPALPGFVAIYITALALGFLIGSPGAAGPFEAFMFLALPDIAPADLAAGIVVYRAVYYLPPVMAALLILARSPAAPHTDLLSGKTLRTRMAWAMDACPGAEAELALAGDKHIYCPADGAGFVAYGISGRIWLVMGDPVAPVTTWHRLIGGLEAEARAAGATLAVYKATARARRFWESRGYHLEPLGEEASVATDSWTVDIRDRRELRRKLRGAEKAGVSLARHRPGTQPLDHMAVVARAWRDEKGHEQGFSMGRWDPDFNARHATVCAWQGDALVGFATFWASGDGTEWMLDLMRQTPDAPNGTMHAILADGIDMAAQAGARRFNLCQAPLSGLDRLDRATPLSRLAHRVYSDLNHRHGLQGMRRFKQLFAPDWSQRFLAVPSRLALPETVLAAHRLVQGRAATPPAHGARTPTIARPAAPAPDQMRADDTAEQDSRAAA